MLALRGGRPASLGPLQTPHTDSTVHRTYCLLTHKTVCLNRAEIDPDEADALGGGAVLDDSDDDYAAKPGKPSR